MISQDFNVIAARNAVLSLVSDCTLEAVELAERFQNYEMVWARDAHTNLQVVIWIWLSNGCCTCIGCTFVASIIASRMHSTCIHGYAVIVASYVYSASKSSCLSR